MYPILTDPSFSVAREVGIIRSRGNECLSPPDPQQAPPAYPLVNLFVNPIVNPLASPLELHIPISKCGGFAIKVLVEIDHTHRDSINPALVDLPARSIKATLQECFDNRLDSLEFIMSDSAFVLNTEHIPFQQNVGLHTIEFSQLLVTIPFQQYVTPHTWTSTDGVRCIISTTIFYQTNDETAKNIDMIASNYIKSFANDWTDCKLADLIATYPKLRPDQLDALFPIAGKAKLALKYHNTTAVLMVTHTVDQTVHQQLTKAFQCVHTKLDINLDLVSALCFGVVGFGLNRFCLGVHRAIFNPGSDHMRPEPMTIQQCRSYSKYKWMAVAGTIGGGLVISLLGMHFGFHIRPMFSTYGLVRCAFTGLMALGFGPLGAVVGVPRRSYHWLD